MRLKSPKYAGGIAKFLTKINFVGFCQDVEDANPDVDVDFEETVLLWNLRINKLLRLFRKNYYNRLPAVRRRFQHILEIAMMKVSSLNPTLRNCASG